VHIKSFEFLGVKILIGKPKEKSVIQKRKNSALKNGAELICDL